jgi:hypothetical protein
MPDNTPAGSGMAGTGSKIHAAGGHIRFRHKITSRFIATVNQRMGSAMATGLCEAAAGNGG